MGLLRPNDLGLFDLHGNLLEWCQNPPKERTSEIVIDHSSLLLYGGAFSYFPFHVRSADCQGEEPASRAVHFGFRPARTFR